MRLHALEIRNFRGISLVHLSDLPNAVVLAGPNGCGKSCVLDALRLLKSAYGEYQENEWQSWFNEFQINIQQLSREAHRVLQDPRRPLLVTADIELTDSEKAYLQAEGEELARQFSWAQAKGRTGGRPQDRRVITPVQKRIHGVGVDSAAREMVRSLGNELDRATLRAEIEMDANGDVNILESAALELIFSTYAPQHVGVIDYHGPNRSYGREQVASVNLNVASVDDRFRQSALYNTQNKYTNVKTEMASAYVRELLSQQAGVSSDRHANLIGALQELFSLFFPGKKFVGPIPSADGGLSFPVELENGLRHDIDELSSGEKEVLLGYLRLRSSAPKNSVILLDEPELHLNPRLVRGLPRFYQKQIGEALGNQLWMITHSDTLLREAVEEPSFAVFHMQPSTAVGQGDNQVHLISVSQEVERAVVDLVGDLATYSPQGRVVLLEGGGDSDVDLNILKNLFPEFAERVNLISAGSKGRVREIHDVFERAAAEGRFRARFFSIVDRDFDGPEQGTSETRFMWDVYHIENYLLNPHYVRMVLETLEIGAAISVDEQVESQLKAAAADTIDGLVREHLERKVNQELYRCIRTAVDPALKPVSRELRRAVERSRDRLVNVVDRQLHADALDREESSIRESLGASLASGEWRSEFRGRDILRRFAGLIRPGVPYETFRNLLINRMRLDGYRPEGMKRVVDSILAK